MRQISSFLLVLPSSRSSGSPMGSLTRPEVGALPDLPKVLETALTEAMALTHARRGLLQLLDPGSQELVVKAHRGFNHRFLRELPGLHLSESHPAGVEPMADVTLVSVEAEPDDARRAALMGE